MSNRPFFVYAIQSQEGHLKIGYSLNPSQRCATINSCSPIQCRVIFQMKGAVAEEQALLRRFHLSRSHGEWLHPTEEVLEFAKSIFGQGVDQVADWVDYPKTFAEKMARTKALRAAAMQKIREKKVAEGFTTRKAVDLVTLQKEMGWTGAKLANYMMVDPGTICQWKKNGVPKSNFVAHHRLEYLAQKISRITGVAVEALLASKAKEVSR